MIRRAAFALALVALVAAGAARLAGRSGDPLVRELESVVDARGASVALTMTRGPGLQRTVTLGDATDEPVPVGSARKWLASAVILTLVDDAVLDLDAPVAAHLPSFSEPPKDRITLRMLLAHTSGMVPRPPDGLCSGGGTLAVCVDRLAGVPLDAAPGEAFAYSSAGFNVAARVAEVATGRRWQDLLADRLLRPLGMTGTFHRPAGPGLPDMVGEIWSPTADYATFLAMVLAGGDARATRILSTDAVHEMTRGQTGAVPKRGTVPRQTWWTEGLDYYGLGMWRNLVDEDGDVLVVSAEGKHGFMAWIDWRNGTAGAITVRGRGLQYRPAFADLIARLGAAYLEVEEMEGDQPSRNRSGSSAWRPSSL